MRVVVLVLVLVLVVVPVLLLLLVVAVGDGVGELEGVVVEVLFDDGEMVVVEGVFVLDKVELGEEVLEEEDATVGARTCGELVVVTALELVDDVDIVELLLRDCEVTLVFEAVDDAAMAKDVELMLEDPVLVTDEVVFEVLEYVLLVVCELVTEDVVARVL